VAVLVELELVAAVVEAVQSYKDGLLLQQLLRLARVTEIQLLAHFMLSLAVLALLAALAVRVRVLAVLAVEEVIQLVVLVVLI